MSLVKSIDYEVEGDFSDSIRVWQRFLEAVNAIKGVTILATLKHDFPGGGMSGIIIIGESHAAIHTWPEKSRAWVQLATCGPVDSLLESEVRINNQLFQAG